ncbi:GntR family transcriptional regulator [Hephaestia sp. MAHUQ-44]|nr:GntR family transcriptional regulator [Hephaestia sp. MAHUQ-44]MCM8729361.1 GntR family transcriptional regulator [Hephaestia sp. MAHUQ-44]
MKIEVRSPSQKGRVLTADRLVSVSTFTDPRLQAGIDPQRNPTQAAAHWLRRDIVRGVFTPLERLKVEQLTKFYGVGHSPVREAILLLSASGLVVHEHQKGYRVAGISLDDYSDLIDVYWRTYQLALMMAVERADEAWEERVVLALHRSLKISKVMTDAEPEARELWQWAYKNLHQELLAGCGSPLLQTIVGDLGARAERYVNLCADLATDRERDSHAEHRVLVDAIVSGDIGSVNKLLEKFFASGEPMRETIRARLRASASAKGRRARRPALA